MANKNLSNAKSAKNDEFYTQLNDIQAEVNAYIDYNPDVFRGKTVLLPCDDPEWSNFTRFFAQNFERFGLKKLISTSYAAASKKIGDIAHAEMRSSGVGTRSLRAPRWYQPSLFEQESPQYDERKTAVRGKIFILDRDANRNGRIDFEDLEWDYLEGDGDFRSEEVCNLRDEADIIVTNPPFSLFREFLAWILDGKCCQCENVANAKTDVQLRIGNIGTGNISTFPHSAKQFLIIGNKNAITYKETFPLIMDNRMWIGATPMTRDLLFELPKVFQNLVIATGKEGSNYKVVDGKTLGRSSSIWFTNLEHGRRHQPLRLMTTAENIKFSKHKEVRGVGYRKYDNYDAIEVPFSDAIPSDCDGIMGVPISFLDKYCPEQFEILGITDRGNVYGIKTREYTEDEIPNANDLNRRGAILVDGALKSTYARLLIRHKR